MARIKFLLVLSFGLAACAPSPLYVARNRVGTVGEIPRDGRGEPIWTAIRRPLPVEPPLIMPSAPGIAISPPPGN